MNRQISTYGKFFNEFYSKLNKDLQDKIDWVFELVKAVDHIPLKKQYFIDKKLKAENEKGSRKNIK
ncbi:MAG: hypothetical protein EAZ13_01985 [Sphingobacteriia bacterium]|nr:MAG: hypothetical protein EAZ13_01985 [Sphingobacteriia bacterium]